MLMLITAAAASFTANFGVQLTFSRVEEGVRPGLGLSLGVQVLPFATETLAGGPEVSVGAVVHRRWLDPEHRRWMFGGRAGVVAVPLVAGIGHYDLLSLEVESGAARSPTDTAGYIGLHATGAALFSLGWDSQIVQDDRPELPTTSLGLQLPMLWPLPIY